MDVLNYNQIKLDIESTSCVIHNQHPEVKISGDQIQIKCCCEDFRSQCNALLQELLIKNAHKSIMDAFKGLK